MILTDILASERVGVARGDSAPASKDAAIRTLARLLAAGHAHAGEGELYRVLDEREALQSTGIGDGVAIPHGAVEGLDRQLAALLICPDGVPFDAIDDRPVRILFAVVGPKRASGEHLKTLARVSRLLRDGDFRERLLASTEAAAAYELVRRAEEGRSGA
jgi:PTS system nitrogen regulatory IIA component